MTEYKQPLFKFLDDEYFDSFMNGEVYLSDIKDFRKPPDDGLIFDEHEGMSFLRPTHESNFPPAAQVFDPTVNHNIFIFCAAKSILSDSLKWAVQAKRSSCCLIISPALIVDDVSRIEEDLTFYARKDCSYIGRYFKADRPITKDEALKQLADTLFLKPTKYSGQLEHRICWLSNDNDRVSKTVKTSKPSELIRVNFVISNELREACITNCEIEINEVKIVVSDLDGNVVLLMSLPYVKDLFTPLVYEEKGQKFIGFKSPNMGLYNASVGGGNIGIRVDDGIMLVGCIQVDKVALIEYEIK